MAAEADKLDIDVTSQFLSGESITPPPGYRLYVDYVPRSSEGYATSDGRRFGSLGDIPVGTASSDVRPLFSVQQRARLVPIREIKG